MAEEASATAEAPARRRDTWSLKSLVEDVTGRSIEELQEPGRPVHPYLLAKRAAAAASASSSNPHRLVIAAARAAAAAEAPPFDPVGRVYPPLGGAVGRALHGREHEHHLETLERHGAAVPAAGPAAKGHGASPSRRPERIYLHYLLLHIDRLSDSALRYLKHSVEEEIAHRQSPDAAKTARA
jgi:hypothetical protein